MGRDQFTLDEFLAETRPVLKVAWWRRVLGCLVSRGHRREKAQFEQLRDEWKQVQAIVSAMTPAERGAPSILDASRRP